MLNINKLKMAWNDLIISFLITKNLKDCLKNISNSYYLNKIYYENRKQKDYKIINRRNKVNKTVNKIEIELK